MSDSAPEATIVHVRVGAAHEGVAELVVTLRHANGGLSEVAMDRIAVDALMRQCAAQASDDLIGVGWDHVRDALAASWNRFNSDQLKATS